MLQGTSNRKVCGFTRQKRVWSKWIEAEEAEEAEQGEGCALFPAFLFCRFFPPFFFKGKHWDWVKVFHDPWDSHDTWAMSQEGACSCIWGWKVQEVALGFCVRHGKVGLRLRRWQGEMLFEVDERCDTLRDADLASKDLKRSSLYKSMSLDQVPGFWFLMSTFWQTLLAANLVLVLRPTVGQRWRISSEEKVQISLKWPPSDCPCRPDSLSPQRSALTSTRTTASIRRSSNNRRFWPTETDGRLFFLAMGPRVCADCDVR